MNEEQTNREIVREHYRRIGKKGGDSTKKKYGKEHYQKVGKEGALKRWGTNNNQ